MVDKTCDIDGCGGQAVFHIHDQDKVGHYCDFHAKEILGATVMSHHEAGELRSCVLSLLLKDGLSQIDVIVPRTTTLLVPEDVARVHCVVSVAEHDGTLTIASKSELSPDVLERIQFIANCKISVLMASEDSIRKAIDLVYSFNQ